MALRLRRGTDSERQLITPVEGELIYTTDTKLLYAGDGSTVGGNVVTGAGVGTPTTLGALQDVDSSSATNNQVLTWIAGSNRWEGTTIPNAGVLSLNDLSNVYTGESIANDSVVAYDGVNWVSRTVGDLFNNSPQVNATIIGNDSTVMVNPANNHFYGVRFNGALQGNSEGFHLGDSQGSVFGGDSTQLIDGNLSRVVGDVINSNISSTAVTLAGAGAGIVINTLQDAEDNVDFFTINCAKDSAYGSSMNYSRSRGTLVAPTALQADDEIMSMYFFGTDTSANKQVSAVIATYADGTPGASTVPGTLRIATANSTGTPTAAIDVNSKQQVTLSGALKVAVYADNTAREAAVDAPVAGMIVFNTTGTKFQGYTGSAWVDLN
jgi:hypothetical protein